MRCHLNRLSLLSNCLLIIEQKVGNTFFCAFKGLVHTKIKNHLFIHMLYGFLILWNTKGYKYY